MPTTGLAGCCANPGNGRAAAAPAKLARKSRRLIATPATMPSVRAYGISEQRSKLEVPDGSYAQRRDDPCDIVFWRDGRQTALAARLGSADFNASNCVKAWKAWLAYITDGPAPM